jgi:hypothetical protein
MSGTPTAMANSSAEVRHRISRNPGFDDRDLTQSKEKEGK